MNNRLEKTDKRGIMENNMLLNVDEVRNILGGVSRSTIYKFVNCKKLQAKKVRNRTMFTTEEVSNFINNLENYEGGTNGF